MAGAYLVPPLPLGAGGARRKLTSLWALLLSLREAPRPSLLAPSPSTVCVPAVVPSSPQPATLLCLLWIFLLVGVLENAYCCFVYVHF